MLLGTDKHHREGSVSWSVDHLNKSKGQVNMSSQRTVDWRKSTTLKVCTVPGKQQISNG